LKKAREEFKRLTLELNKRLDEDSSLAIQTGNLRQSITKKARRSC